MSQQSLKLGSIQRSNFVSSDKLSIAKPQTPGTGLIENPMMTKGEGWNPGTINFNSTGSVATIRPKTVQQK